MRREQLNAALSLSPTCVRDLHHGCVPHNKAGGFGGARAEAGTRTHWQHYKQQQQQQQGKPPLSESTCAVQ